MMGSLPWAGLCLTWAALRPVEGQEPRAQAQPPQVLSSAWALLPILSPEHLIRDSAGQGLWSHWGLESWRDVCVREIWRTGSRWPQREAVSWHGGLPSRTSGRKQRSALRELQGAGVPEP